MKGSDSDGGWQGRNTSTVVKTITDASPDVVCFQEDDDSWYKDGAWFLSSGTNHLADLTKKAGYTSTNFAGYGNERLNIFYKTSKFNFVTSGTMLYKDLANTDGFKDVEPNYNEYHDADTQKQGRFFSYVVLEDKTTGAIVLVANTHLHYMAHETDDEQVNDAINMNLRVAQAKLLNAWLDSMAEQYPNQVVVGDMNNTPGTQTINALAEDMQIARDTARIVGDNGGTLASTSNYTRRDSEIFDHIIYRTMTAFSYTVIDNKIDEVNGEMRYPSDHLPVWVELVIKN